jgi:glutathione S-transferase kappa 1
LTRERFDALLAESQSAENKARVKDEAQALVKDDGCFGFPWIKVQKPDGQVQNWFGSDRMDNIAYWLGDGYKYEGPHPKGVTARSKL